MSKSKIYQTLSHPYAIRRLELLPGNRFHPIICQFDEIDIEKCGSDGEPSFEAISYTWGDPFHQPLTGTGFDLKSLQCKKIICNGETISISANLYDALIRLRNRETSRFLWADQLCINQADVSERNKQVDIMYDIYAKARRVLIWLGEADSSSDEAMDFLETVIKNLNTMAPSDAAKYMKDLSKKDTSSRSPTMVAVYKLLTRSWFSRMWTIQEAARAREALLICGNKQFSFELLEIFNARAQTDTEGSWVSLLSSITTATDANQKVNERWVTAHVHTVSRLKEMESQDVHNIARMLQLVRTCGVSEESDRIYAIYRFFPDLRRRIGPPDYANCPVDELFRRLAKVMLLDYKNVDYLNAAETSLGDISKPSWVVDWSQPDLYHPFWLNSQVANDTSGSPLYAASLQASPDVEINGQVLGVNGKILCQVKKVCEAFDFPTSAANEAHSTSAVEQLTKSTNVMLRLMENRRVQIDQCLEVVAQHVTRLNKKARITACRQTLLAGCMTKGKGNIVGGVQIRVSNADANKLFESFSSLTRYLSLSKSSARALQLLAEKPGQERRAAPAESLWTRLWKLVVYCCSAIFSLYVTIKTIVIVLLVAWASANQKPKTLLDAFHEAARGRTFFITEDQQMGLGPKNMRVGDEICVFFGCSVPTIVRKADGRKYKVVGECYLNGFMDGEAMSTKGLFEGRIYLQ